MTNPNDNQVADLRNAIDKLTRRFKIAETAGNDGPKLNQIDLQAMFFVADHPFGLLTKRFLPILLKPCAAYWANWA